MNETKLLEILIIHLTLPQRTTIDDEVEEVDDEAGVDEDEP